jgi:hypothetical protein
MRGLSSVAAPGCLILEIDHRRFGHSVEEEHGLPVAPMPMHRARHTQHERHRDRRIDHVSAARQDRRARSPMRADAPTRRPRVTT